MGIALVKREWMACVRPQVNEPAFCTKKSVTIEYHSAITSKCWVGGRTNGGKGGDKGGASGLSGRSAMRD